jgi:YHS domain-containing protein
MIFFTLLRLLLVAALVYLIYRLFWPKKRQGRTTKGSGTTAGRMEEMKKDPICGTYVPESQALSMKVEAQTHYFCSEDCRKKFLELKGENSKNSNQE